MRVASYLAVCLAVTSPLLVCATNADSTDAKPPQRGIAVLASSIGSDYSTEGLARFVKEGKFSTVVIDWAWITYHWNVTDFAEVNRFLDRMASQNVQVAAMYRPRFLQNPTVATQVGQDGKADVDHAEICYSDATARKWGIAWGTKILEKCPRIKEVIVYNPSDNCQCAKCTASRAKAPHAAVMAFLAEAKSAWQVKRPDVKLGVVYVPAPDFWKAGLTVIDVAHPYLCVRTEIDPVNEITNIKASREVVKDKMGCCLAKVTWEAGAKVTPDKLKTIDELAAKDGIAYCFWTFATLFDSSDYDAKAVATALGMDAKTIADTIARMKQK